MYFSSLVTKQALSCYYRLALRELEQTHNTVLYSEVKQKIFQWYAFNVDNDDNTCLSICHINLIATDVDSS